MKTPKLHSLKWLVEQDMKKQRRDDTITFLIASSIIWLPVLLIVLLIGFWTGSKVGNAPDCRSGIREFEPLSVL